MRKLNLFWVIPLVIVLLALAIAAIVAAVACFWPAAWLLRKFKLDILPVDPYEGELI